MQVLDRYDQCPAAAAVQAPAAQRFEHPGLDRLGAELGQPCCALTEAEQMQHIGSVAVGVQPDLLQPEPHLLDDDLGRVRIHDPAVGADHIDDGQIRHAAAEGQAAPLQVGDLPRGQAAPELIQQP